MPSFEDTLGFAQWIAQQYGESAPHFIVRHLGLMILSEDEMGVLEWKQVAAAYVLLQSAAGQGQNGNNDDEGASPGPSLSQMRRREAALRLTR